MSLEPQKQRPTLMNKHKFKADHRVRPQTQIEVDVPDVKTIIDAPYFKHMIPQKKSDQNPKEDKSMTHVETEKKLELEPESDDDRPYHFNLAEYKSGGPIDIGIDAIPQAPKPQEQTPKKLAKKEPSNKKLEIVKET